MADIPMVSLRTDAYTVAVAQADCSLLRDLALQVSIHDFSNPSQNLNRLARSSADVKDLLVCFSRRDGRGREYSRK